ncbi:hypothetical protein M1437_00845 [Patescibacteria group bacterium]|nr:hypothetical protein [Patescibacteria group bacterium]
MHNTERPIYSTEPDQPESIKMSLKDAVMGAVIMSAMFGGASWLIWEPRVGIEVGVGTGGLLGGILLSPLSSDRAVELAKDGKKTRAYVEALRASLESAIGLASAGVIWGYGIGDTKGAIIGGVGGVFIGGIGFGQIAFGGVSRALRERAEITP